MSYFLTLFLLLLVAIIGIVLRSRTPRTGQLLLLCGSLGCATLVIWQARTLLWSDSNRPPDRYHASAAYVIAHEAAREIGAGRGRLCLLLPPDSAAGSDTLDTIYNTFARVLGPSKRVELVETTVEISRKEFRAGEIPFSRFEQALQTASNAVAVVSFVGLPKQAEKLSLFAKSNPPPFLVFAPADNGAWQEPLKQRLIRSVVLPRPDAQQRKTQPIAGPPNEIFQAYFVRHH